MKLRLAKRDSPTASPTPRPITTEIANATASSQNVIAAPPECLWFRTARQARPPPRRRAQKRRVDPPPRGDFPQQKQGGDDAEPRQAGMAEQRALEIERLAHRRLARRSSELTVVLSRAAIATAKAM